MPIAPGTALQNGHYVVDALLEAAPNGDLYWGTHVVAGMPVFIQVFPLGGAAGQNDLSSLIARLEGVAFAPQSPLPNPLQLFRGDNQTLCLAMSTTIGLPWSSARKNASPLSPKYALAKIRQIADSVIWLKAQGLSGLDLAPNRVWLSPDQATVTLTGLPHAYLQNVDAPAAEPDTSTQALAKLLFSFLTGQAPTVVEGKGNDAVRDELKQHCPNLSPVIVAAIAQGIQSAMATPPVSLTQWLQDLPDTGTAYQVQPPSRQLTRSQPTPVDRMPHTATQPRIAKPTTLLSALAGTALLAAIAGVTLGTYWRLNAQGLPGAIQLDPKQSFPTQTGWSADTPEVTFDEPYVPSRNAPPPREDWYEEPAPEIYETSPPPEPVNNAIEATDDFDPGVDLGSDSSSDGFDEGIDPAPGLPADLPSDSPRLPAESDVNPLDEYDAPEPVPLETNSIDFSNPNDALLQPSPVAVPKTLPSSESASES